MQGSFGTQKETCGGTQQHRQHEAITKLVCLAGDCDAAHEVDGCAGDDGDGKHDEAHHDDDDARHEHVEGSELDVESGAEERHILVSSLPL